MPEQREFVLLADRFRPELLAHCYRMLGSVDDAEDLVQETYLRAWRAYEGFEGRSSLRAWLYRIATSACLTALEHRSRRFLPSGLGVPGERPDGPSGQPQVAWIQPLPTSVPDPEEQDPAAVVAARDGVRLALVAALQHLPPRQRVVLILRDVLAWRAAEVAELLDTTPTAVNSALQRARAQLELVGPAPDDPPGPLDGAHRSLLDRYAAAFERADMDALLGLLHEDVTLEMPPEAAWFAGREAVAGFIVGRILPTLGTVRLRRATANGQPAVAVYSGGPDGPLHAHALMVLTLRAGAVSGIVAFREPFPFGRFGLPAEILPEPR